MNDIKKILLLLLVCISGTTLNAQMNPKIKLQDALKLIQDNYVDRVDDERVVDVAIKAMLGDLDPHSSYINREEVEAMNQSMSGIFAGIGITFSMVNDSTYITAINADGPAFKAGVKLGDRILAIDGKSIVGKGLKNQQVMMMIRGEKGKVVELEISRKLLPAPLRLSVVRSQIAELSINTYYMIDKKIGYISLAIFSQSTRREIDEALKALKAQGMSKLILDLQSNGGGFVEAAIGVADEFLPKEKLVFYSVTNTGVKDNYYTGGFGQFMQGDLVVLIDESTASSSEIVTGALQDWDRAVVIGRRSFGKGLMQKGLPLADGSVIRLTAARYYTPSGRSIQKPYEKGKVDYFQDFNRRKASGELSEEVNFKFPDSLRFTTLTTKRTVFGGGGIMPDKFVPIDTALYSNWMSKAMNSGLVTKIAFDNVQRSREAIKQKYPDFESFNKSFQVNDSVIDQVFNQALGLKIAMPSREDAVARKALATELKSELSAQIYTGRGLQLQVRNLKSEAFLTALSILRNQERYNEMLKATKTSVKSKQRN